MRPGEMSVQDHAEGDRHTVLLGGEWDLATGRDVLAAIEQVLAQGACELVLDIGELTYIDSTGIRGILSIRELCERHECEFGVTLGQAQVQRVFKIAGLEDVLPFPASQDGDGTSPASQDGDRTSPASQDGDRTSPASEDGDRTNPASQDGDGTSPARRMGTPQAG